jgi:hypothetical protein
MAEFSFNLAGFAFQEGLAHLRTSFEAAGSAVELEVTRGRAALDGYVRAVHGGAEPSTWAPRPSSA